MHNKFCQQNIDISRSDGYNKRNIFKEERGNDNNLTNCDINTRNIGKWIISCHLKKMNDTSNRKPSFQNVIITQTPLQNHIQLPHEVTTPQVQRMASLALQS